ncbi:MAG: hypothetical protein LC667_15585 [Thioalkalivibrio sp.]|nr:hypothetical protein [Thioalkalivibrio sp.]
MQGETGDPGDSSAEASSLAERERRLHERLRAIESDASSLRARTRWLASGLVLAMGLLGTMVFRPDLLPVPSRVAAQVIEAGQLVLVDADGQRRGEWGVAENGDARLLILDEDGRQRLTLSVGHDGVPGLSLANAAGQRRVALGLLSDETTSLVFADGGGVPRAVLGLTRGEAASLVFADSDGVSRMGMGVDRSGTGSVMLPEEAGEDLPDPDG